MQPTAGRSEAASQFMRTPPLQEALRKKFRAKLSGLKSLARTAVS